MARIVTPTRYDASGKWQMRVFGMTHGVAGNIGTAYGDALRSAGWFTPSLVGTSSRSYGLTPSRQPTL